MKIQSVIKVTRQILDQTHLHSLRRILKVLFFSALVSSAAYVITACRNSAGPENNDVYDLVYQSGNGLDQGIYLANSSTAKNERMTPTDIRAYSPTWSPDGKKIAYIAAPIKNQSGIDSIYIISLPDLRTSQLSLPPMSLSGLSGLSWSPDGKYIAFEAPSYDNGRSALLVVGVNNQQLLKLANDLSSPRWSPNGSQIAAVNQSSLCLVTIAERQQQCFDLNAQNVFTNGLKSKLSFDSIQDPFWFPSGTIIGFVGNTPDGIGLFSIKSSGTDVEELLSPLRLGLCNPSFSQDAKSIILANCEEDVHGLYLLELGTDHLTPLNFGKWANSPAWRPVH